MNKPPTPPYERVMAKTAPGSNGCVIFTGARDRKGYGKIGGLPGESPRMAHRVVYERWWGPITKEHVAHRCDNPPCVNPYHLFLATPKENNEDKVTKGRSGLLDYCHKGHPLTESNRMGKAKRCRQCSYEYSRAWYAKNGKRKQP